MKYCKDPHAIYAKYEGCSNDEYKPLLYLLYQFFTDLQRMSHYLTLDIPHQMLHLLLQFLKTDAIYIQRNTKNVHIFPYIASLEPLIQEKLKRPVQNPLRISLQYSD